MSLFTPGWLKSGPGVPKDAPPKTGFALLLDVIARNWWELIQLNLLVILFCLPLITVPAALVAAARICALMLEDRPIYLGRDFLETFRGRFVTASFLGIAAIALIALSLTSTIILLQAARTNILFALPFTIGAATTLFALVATAYAIALLALRNQPLASLLKRAMLGAIVRPVPALAALAVVAVLWLLHILFYPASIFMPALINFSFGMLAVTFGVHEAAVRLLAPHSAIEGAAYAGGSAQSALNKGKEPQ